MPDNISPVADHGCGGFAAFGSITVITGDNTESCDSRYSCFGTQDKGVLDPALGRVVTATHKADDATLGHQRGQGAGAVGHVPVGGVNKHGVGRNLFLRLEGGRKEGKIRIVRRDLQKGAAKLKAVTDDQLVAIISIATGDLRNVGLGNILGEGDIKAFFLQAH